MKVGIKDRALLCCSCAVQAASIVGGRKEPETGRGTECRFTPRAVRNRAKPLRAAALRGIFSFGARLRATPSKSCVKLHGEAGLRSFQPNLQDVCGIFFENLVDFK